MFLTFQNAFSCQQTDYISHVTNNSLRNIKYHFFQYSSDGGDIDLTKLTHLTVVTKTWCCSQLIFIKYIHINIIILFIYIDSINYCIKTKTTNSNHVIVYKAFIHLSMFVYHQNTNYVLFQNSGSATLTNQYLICCGVSLKSFDGLSVYLSSLSWFSLSMLPFIYLFPLFLISHPWFDLFFLPQLSVSTFVSHV